MQYYVLTMIDKLDVDERKSVNVFTSEEDAKSVFEAIKTRSEDMTDKPGTYFCDESVDGIYYDMLMFYKNDVVTIIVQLSED